MKIIRYLGCVLTVLASVMEAQTPYGGSPNSGVFTSGTYLYKGLNINAANLIVDQTANVTFKARDHIKISPSSSITSLNGGARFGASIDQSTMYIADMTGNWNPNKWERFEIGVALPSTIQNQIDQFLNGSPGMNPYEPAQVYVRADFSIGGNNYTRYGFYYVDFPSNGNQTAISSPYSFRVRFAPPTLGQYNFTISYYLNNNSSPAESVSGTFNCNNSGHKGLLTIGNYRHLKDANGNSFFSIGQNVAYAGSQCPPTLPSDFDVQRNYISDIFANGGNWVRFRMDPFSYDVEWEELGVYGANRINGENYLRQWNAWQLDKTLELCEQKEMYVFFTLLGDGSFKHADPEDYCPYHYSQWDSDISKNPYSTILNAPEDFLTNTAARDYYKRKLFYITARYGYSPNIAVYSLINETDGFNNYGGNLTVQSKMSNWLQTMSLFLNQYYPHHLITSGYASGNAAGNSNFPNFSSQGNGINPYADLVSCNNYGSKRVGISDRHNQIPTYVGEYIVGNYPFIYGELGMASGKKNNNPYNCDGDKYTDVEFHDAIWSTSMNSNAIGCGMYWWDWAQQYINHRSNFRALSAFFTQEPPPFETNDFSSQWNCNTAIPGNRDIEWIANVNQSGSRGFGWVHNSSYFCFSDPNGLHGGYPNNGLDEAILYCPDGESVKNSSGKNKVVKLLNYQSFKKFDIEYWSCYNNGGKQFTFTKKANIFGSIKFTQGVGAYPGDQNLGDPDFGFKVYRHGQSFRQVNDTLDLLTSNSDTECVSISNPCIQTYGFVEEAVNNSHLWNFGNGSSSNIESPLICYNSTGTYLIQHSYINQGTGARDTLQQYITIVYCDSTASPENDSRVHESESLKSYNITQKLLLFPNPVTDELNVVSEKEMVELEIVNTFNESTGVHIVQGNHYTIKNIDMARGVYYVKVKFSDGQRGCVKFIKY